MKATQVVRTSLWISFPFNLGAAYALALPSSQLGRLLGLSESVDPLYSALCAFLIGMFGFAYAWLALQPKLDQPLLCLGAIGKTGVFVLAVVLWLSQVASGAIVVVASGDVAFALLWFWWLVWSKGSHED